MHELVEVGVGASAARRASFKPAAAVVECTERLAARLAAEKDRLDAVDARSKGGLRQDMLVATGRELWAHLDTGVRELQRVTVSASADEHQANARWVRTRLREYLMAGEFAARALSRPRGYSGDHVMMQMIYDNELRGSTSFARLMHKHPLRHAAAHAVRNRRQLVAQRLAAMLETRPGPRTRPVRILSLACGPARELEDTIRATGLPLHVVLVDMDAEALRAAEQTVERVRKEAGDRLSATTVCIGVKALVASAIPEALAAPFDFIYALGLFDYLDDDDATRLVDLLRRQLTGHGRLFIGNFQPRQASRTYMEYWLDWWLHYRTAPELRALAPEAGEADVLLSEATGCQLFLEVGTSC